MGPRGNHTGETTGHSHWCGVTGQRTVAETLKRMGQLPRPVRQATWCIRSYDMRAGLFDGGLKAAGGAVRGAGGKGLGVGRESWT